MVRAGHGAPFIDAALDRKGDLQAHRHRQRSQIEPVPAKRFASQQPRVKRRTASTAPPIPVVPT
jgi:hypothetical protein